MARIGEIKGFYVDASGVIWYDGFPPTVDKFAKRYGVEPTSLQRTKDGYWPDFSLGRIGPQQFWRKTFAEHGIRLSEDEIRRLDMEVLEAHSPYHDVMATIKDLQPRYNVGLLTNSPREWIDYWGKKFHLRELFQIIITPYESGVRKDDIEMFEYAARKMGLEPKEIAFFDDQTKNVNVAKQSGMLAVEVIPGTNPFLEFDTKLMLNEK